MYDPYILIVVSHSHCNVRDEDERQRKGILPPLKPTQPLSLSYWIHKGCVRLLRAYSLQSRNLSDEFKGVVGCLRFRLFYNFYLF
jgi:hypothetical protein